MWKFTSDATGGGAWSEEGINYTTSQSLLRPGGQDCGITLGEVGYYVGVRVWEEPDVNASPTGYCQDTITAFNISANTWSSTLKTSIGTEGTIQGASIGTISALGLDKRGLLVLIGGKDPGTNVSDAYYGFSHYFNFSNTTIYDPYIDVWYAQTATGDIPGVRIFLHGNYAGR